MGKEEALWKKEGFLLCKWLESRRHGLGLAGGRGPKKSNQVRFHCDLAHPRGKSSNARQVSKWNEKGWFLLTSNEISIRATGFFNFMKHFHDILNIFIDMIHLLQFFKRIYVTELYPRWKGAFGEFYSACDSSFVNLLAITAWKK